MMLWILLTVVMVIAAVGLTIPLVRRYDDLRARRAPVLKDPVADIDAQQAAAHLSPGEAKSLRTEIRRPVLADAGGETEPAPSPVSDPLLMSLALGLAALVVFGATGLYLNRGRPELTRAPPAGAPSAMAETAGLDSSQPGASHPGGDVANMIGQLEARLKESPNDPEGWRMLGWSYMQTARYAAAAIAYGRAAALDPKADYLSAQGEALVQASQGQVTPEALSAFHRAVAADPTDPRARYFLAVYKDQHGDHHGAMSDWIALLKSAPADAPWASEVRTFVLKLARTRGLSIAGQLPPAPVSGDGADTTGPTPDQVAAAGQMPPGDQQAMIQTMVEGLAARLKTNPRDSIGWVRLMRARMVLNQPGAAQAAYRDALKAFGDDPAQKAAIANAARGMGIPGV